MVWRLLFMTNFSGNIHIFILAIFNKAIHTTSTLLSGSIRLRKILFTNGHHVIHYILQTERQRFSHFAAFIVCVL